jgi:hypothetical protein
MNIKTNVLHVAALGLIPALFGCSSMNQFASRSDMVVSHIAEHSEPVVEGRLVSLQKFGTMIAIELNDGRIFDVDEAPDGLLAGDVVRIYQSDNRTAVHLWRRDPYGIEIGLKTL